MNKFLIKNELEVASQSMSRLSSFSSTSSLGGVSTTKTPSSSSISSVSSITVNTVEEGVEMTSPNENKGICLLPEDDCEYCILWMCLYRRTVCIFFLLNFCVFLCRI